MEAGLDVFLVSIGSLLAWRWILICFIPLFCFHVRLFVVIVDGLPITVGAASRLALFSREPIGFRRMGTRVR